VIKPQVSKRIGAIVGEAEHIAGGAAGLVAPEAVEEQELTPASRWDHRFMCIFIA